MHQCWERCLNDDAITIPHRVIRIYDEGGDCTQVITTNFLHRDDDSENDPNQEEEDHDEQEAVAESLEEDNEGNAAEITVLEEESTPDSNDLSGDYSDDENNEEKLQPLVTSPPLAEVANRNVIPKSPTCQQSGKSLSNDRPSPNMPETKGINTKLCKNIARIVGETECVYKLDTARQNMKQHPTSIFHTNNYQNLLAVVQTKILAHHTSLKKQHKDWERQYYLDHDCTEASLEDLKTDKEQYSIYKKLVLCEELLKHWKITVHL